LWPVGITKVRFMPTSAEEANPPTPAATVVVLRDGQDSVEVLMLRRNSALAFGGMWVFPGGRVDPADLDPADLDLADLDDLSPSGVDGSDRVELAAARRAAAREAREEAGLAIAVDQLVPFSHWVPPPQAPRRFFTWFFLASAPEGAAVVVDGGEIREHEWMAPVEAMRRRDSGQIELAPPTWVTLWRLSHAPDVSSAIAEASRVHPERFETHMARADDGMVAVWHGDAAYADGNLARSGPRHRLWMQASGWRYERHTP
jgi:8-oxo-dGTP pyrophosphatase MutT (NUDIX family)